jgi:hypothetical protein
VSESKTRKQLQSEISAIKKRREVLRDEQHISPNRNTEAALRELRPGLRLAEKRLEQFESGLLVKEAHRRGLVISKDADWWSSDRGDYEGHGWDEQFIKDMTATWLSESGRAIVRRLIAEDRKKNIEWWFRIIMPLLSVLRSYGPRCGPSNDYAKIVIGRIRGNT